MSDPCNCESECPHGDRCLGGHANYPDSHWYHCENCTKWCAEGFLVDGGVTFVMADCRHVIGPGQLSDVSREVISHRRTCVIA